MPETKTGTIVEKPSPENGYFYVVDVDGEDRMYLRGSNVAKSPEVGQRGTLTYRRGASYALWFWDPV